MDKNTSDIHHCRCFQIDENYIVASEDMLKEIGFEETLEEDHGQVFGLRLMINKELQIHVKVMPSGIIESEMEPPPEYPGAHINQNHSYSSHELVEKILNEINIPHTILDPVPETCTKPKIIKPENPYSWKEMVCLGIGAGAAIGIGAVVVKYMINKKK